MGVHGTSYITFAQMDNSIVINSILFNSWKLINYLSPLIKTFTAILVPTNKDLLLIHPTHKSKDKEPDNISQTEY